jgi:hypothetical protein
MSAGARHSEKAAAETAATTTTATDGRLATEQQTEELDREREAAKAKLAQLQRQQSDMIARVEAAKAAALKAAREKHGGPSRRCLDNPLAAGCDDDNSSGGDGKVDAGKVVPQTPGGGADAIALQDAFIAAMTTSLARCFTSATTVTLACRNNRCTATRIAPPASSEATACVTKTLSKTAPPGSWTRTLSVSP